MNEGEFNPFPMPGEQSLSSRGERGEEISAEEKEDLKDELLELLFEQDNASDYKRFLLDLNEGNYPQSVLQDIEIQKRVRRQISRSMITDSLNLAATLGKIFFIPDEEMKDMATVAFREFLEEDLFRAMEVQRQFNVYVDVETQKEILEEFLPIPHQAEGVVLAVKEFGLSEETLSDPEVHEVVKKTIKDGLGKLSKDPNGDISVEALGELKDLFGITDNEYQEIIKNLFLEFGRDDADQNNLAEILKRCKIADSILKDPEVQEAVRSCLLRGDGNSFFINDAIKIKKEFALPEEWLRSQEVQIRASEILEDVLNSSEISDARKLVDEFFVPEHVAKKMARAHFLRALKRAPIAQEQSKNYFAELVDSFGFSLDEVQEVEKEAVIFRLGSDQHDVYELLEAMPLPKEQLEAGGVQEKAREVFLLRVMRGGTESALNLRDKFYISDEFIASEKGQHALMIGVTMAARAGLTSQVKEMAEAFNASDEIVREAVDEAIEHNLETGMYDVVEKIRQELPVREEDVKMALEKAVLKSLTLGTNERLTNKFNKLLAMAGKFFLDKEFIESEKVQKEAKNMLLRVIDEKTVDILKVFMEAFCIPESYVGDEDAVGGRIESRVIVELGKGNVQGVIEWCTAFNIEFKNQAIKAWFEMREDPGVSLAIKNSKEVAVYVAKCKDQNVEKIEAALRARATHYLSPLDYDMVAAKGEEYLIEDERGKYDSLTAAQVLEDFQDKMGDANIAEMMRKCDDMFGTDVMIRYSSRPDMTRHDALHFMPDIEKLFQKSGLTEAEFAQKILLQIARDGAAYPEGSAHHKFAFICQALAEVDIAKQIEVAKEYSSVKKMQELVAELEAGAGVFSSWKMLKKFYDLNQLLQKREILDELKDEAMPAKLREFVETLAFHPSIAMDKVLQFWREPAQFLQIDDADTDEEINVVKKPSNYISLPYLGLSAVDLRDAFVEGVLDKLQTLPPMEKTYEISETVEEIAFTPRGLQRDLIRALGKRKEKKRGRVRRPRKLFQNLKFFCDERDMDVKDLVDEKVGVGILEKMSSEDMELLRAIVFDDGFGMQRGDVYRVRMGKKSDPSMTVAGNDTASCMKFGSGKNNVYMFNLNCVQLVVERQAADGSWRTAAQSVMTIDAKASKPTPELIKGYLEHQSLKDLLDPQDFANQDVLTCDNIEPAKNEEGERERNITRVYEAFSRDYLKEHADELDLDPTRVIVGMGYTPDGLDLDKVDNYYVLHAPMGYSDNVHEKCYKIETGLEKGERKPRKRIRLLKTGDAIAAAYIEGKAYHDNDSLLEYLHKIQNNIIGKEIANAKFSRPELSFLAQDDDGIPQAYMIAYEGVYGSEREPQIYIADLAADPEKKMAAPALVRTFLRTYFENYGIEDRAFVPIFTEAREQTSYQWILKLAETMAKKNNAVVEIEEGGIDTVGGDKMHNVRIYIGRDKEEIAEQKEGFAGLDHEPAYEDSGDSENPFEEDEDWE